MAYNVSHCHHDTGDLRNSFKSVSMNLELMASLDQMV
jgi:hypothetical protein